MKIRLSQLRSIIREVVEAESGSKARATRGKKKKK